MTTGTVFKADDLARAEGGEALRSVCAVRACSVCVGECANSVRTVVYVVPCHRRWKQCEQCANRGVCCSVPSSVSAP